jgi:hypothetical protein
LAGLDFHQLVYYALRGAPENTEDTEIGYGWKDIFIKKQKKSP